MNTFTTIIKTERYADAFPCLINELKGKVNSISGRNLVFCEEKASLMAESVICSIFKGTFNTDVYSFGKYLKKFGTKNESLSKEGSAMAVKYVLSYSNLISLSPSKNMLAPTLYELIIQLKSAKVTPSDLINASKNLTGVLKNKIIDIATVFSGYEKFLQEKGLFDQGSLLSLLPELLENDQSLENTDVYLVGYSSWTAQARSIVKVLLKKAKSVTAILSGGDSSVYLNETSISFMEIAKDLGINVVKKEYASNGNAESKLILKETFNLVIKEEKFKTDKVKIFSPSSPYQEIEFIAEKIKQKILENNARYLDFTICLSSLEEYSEIIKEIFTRLEIPFFIDEKKQVISHPLVKLVISYLTSVQKNLERDAFLTFVKNPLVTLDREKADAFENYVLKYNVNFSRFNSPFIYGDESEIAVPEEVRVNAVKYFENFSILGLIEKLNVKEKLTLHAKMLSEKGAKIECAVNEQVYDFVLKLLQDMQFILKGENLSVKETKDIFLSGVLAGELSVIPQYYDAVFVGLYKNTSLLNAKYLFAPNLNSNVPTIKEDVALLTDSDINKLLSGGVIIEPKIRHVNKRAKEETAMALSAFDLELYLSCPTTNLSGDFCEKSRIIFNAEALFDSQCHFNLDGYYSFNQGLLTFAKSTSNFVDGVEDDFTIPATFYKANKDTFNFNDIERASEREVKIALNDNKEIIAFNQSSPTVIEEFYACPYRAFLSKGLGLEPRKQGQVDSLFIGTFEHNVLDKYVKEVFIDKTCQVNNKQDSDTLVEKIIEEIKKVKNYDFLSQDESLDFKLASIISEVKGFCYKVKSDIDNSLFKPFKTEAGFNFEIGNNAKLVGKVDRIDKYQDYVRIIDYKTGTPSIEEKELFIGRKLQLFLYALAAGELKLAGVYYQPVDQSNYDNEKPNKNSMIGKTLASKETIIAQDLAFKEFNRSDVVPVTIKGEELLGAFSEEELSAYISYAKTISEKAMERISQGVIVSSPLEKSCEYCPYTAICENNLFERKVKEVDTNVILESVKGAKNVK
ncbi:MAG: exodeoxyribonuclease V subunit gamma [Clostridia bacterium]|nr:exodeoxyribonuclease V subunit gamma [Clostridia bacterium]